MTVEAYTNGKDILFRNRPAVYSGRRKGLGPAQLRWIAERGWLAGPRIVRTKTHAKDCPHVHTVSAYICSCQEEPK